jgi:hypothetical protein
MQPVGNLMDAHLRLAEELTQLTSDLRERLHESTINLNANLSLLRHIRAVAYEDTNQILHEALLLDAIDHLQKLFPQPIEWHWNPRQTGDSLEPDLQGIRLGSVLISAEGTTSEDPQGVIDSRMRDTLKKLSTQPGDLFYFVQTESMKQRALTKVGKAGYRIQVVLMQSL